MCHLPSQSGSRRALRREFATAAGAAMLGGVLLLAGCSASPGADNSASAASVSDPSTSAPSGASSTPTPTGASAPTFHPDGTAVQNLPIFAATVDAVWAGPQGLSGRAYVDALVAAGFDKGAMQLTPDQSTVGNPAETIMFSVRWDDECLVGQVGPATAGAISVVLPGLTDGGCLVGSTRSIDW